MSGLQLPLAAGSVDFKDAGVLAAAVGPVPVQAGRKRKRELLVLLGLRCPEDEVGLLASFAVPIGCSEHSYGTLWWQ